MIINTNTQIDLSPIVQRTLESYYNPRIGIIETCAFCKCSKLTTVNFPNVTSIGLSAFYNCSKLTTVSFPKVTYLGTGAFYYCSKLTTVSFPALTGFIGSSAFYNCYSLNTISFQSASGIGSYAFRYCYSLTTASFPKVSSIGNSAFANCYRLTKLYLNYAAVVSLGGSSVFYSSPIGGYSTSAGTYGSVYVPTSLVSSYKTATYWSSIADRIIGF